MDQDEKESKRKQKEAKKGKKKVGATRVAPTNGSGRKREQTEAKRGNKKMGETGKALFSCQKQAQQHRNINRGRP
ncbi:hypothetical protein [Salipaludibacillus aurantiacus]|uniref:hypothetical protein n=1 Tax=Salipaludibacillus aurantiacus TaxID=1601833 RepID=UPI000B893B3F|nr:hypothetical protein [Salipaludibacillus aurantiacus]